MAKPLTSGGALGRAGAGGWAPKDPWNSQRCCLHLGGGGGIFSFFFLKGFAGKLSLLDRLFQTFPGELSKWHARGWWVGLLTFCLQIFECSRGRGVCIFRRCCRTGACRASFS